MGVNSEVNTAEMTDDDLLEALGIGSDLPDPNDITVLRHVRANVERRAAVIIADHTPCADFDDFKPLFWQVEHDLATGVRKSIRFGRNTRISCGDCFILGGQITYVAEVVDICKAQNGLSDARLRVIYGNGTESNLLLRSLQRALYKDSSGRRISRLA